MNLKDLTKEQCLEGLLGKDVSINDGGGWKIHGELQRCDKDHWCVWDSPSCRCEFTLGDMDHVELRFYHAVVIVLYGRE